MPIASCPSHYARRNTSEVWIAFDSTANSVLIIALPVCDPPVSVAPMKPSKTILVVEDETDLRELIVFNLEREGYRCRQAPDGDAALAETTRSVPDLVILDRMLPNTSGDDVLAKLRRDECTAAVPVVMLTAKADESDELVGFALGADDYVTKPFSMKALVARVGALLRRSKDSVSDQTKGVLSSGPVMLDTERHTVRVDGKTVSLTATEFRLLKAIISAAGRLRSREQLIDAALGQDVAVVDRTIDVHIAALRKKLGPAAIWVQTVRGVGYTWRSPQQSDET
jgi:two-component system, OmpR family, phosphate regulon response regulator PhoB